MRRVEQKEKFGCGVACVAMLAGLSYSQARQHAPEITKDGLDTDEIRLLARKVGVSLDRRLQSFFGRKPHDVLNQDAMLMVNNLRLRHGIVGHWVVWDARRRTVLDPEIEKLRRKRYRFHSYVLVKSRWP